MLAATYATSVVVDPLLHSFTQSWLPDAVIASVASSATIFSSPAESGLGLAQPPWQIVLLRLARPKNQPDRPCLGQ